MRYLLAAAVMLGACVAPNPDYDPAAAALYWSSGDSGIADLSAPDLSSPTCGRTGEPCCVDGAGRRFCTIGECGGERCGVPDLAVVRDLCSTPDLTWRPDLTGGACVEKCGACRLRDDCCDGTLCLDKFNNSDPSQFPGFCRRQVDECPNR